MGPFFWCTNSWLYHSTTTAPITAPTSAQAPAPAPAQSTATTQLKLFTTILSLKLVLIWPLFSLRIFIIIIIIIFFFFLVVEKMINSGLFFFFYDASIQGLQGLQGGLQGAFQGTASSDVVAVSQAKKGTHF
jgi:hypothetical protein